MATIMIVDDSAVFRTMLRDILEEEGHTVVEAVDGNDALLQYEKHRPDMAFVDIFMPGKEGLSTIKELLEKRPSFKIVAVSSGSTFTDTETLEWAKSYGATRTMPKPLDPTQVAQVLRELLR